MTAFLKWAENVLDKVDEKATDTVKDLRGEKGSSAEGRVRRSSSDDKVRRPSADRVKHSPSLDASPSPPQPPPTSIIVEGEAGDPSSFFPAGAAADPPLLPSSPSLVIVEPSVSPEPSLSPAAKKPEGSAELENENAQLKAKVQELTIEAGGLRTVWQETRDALSRAKKLLIQKDDQYKKALKEKDAEVQREVDSVHAHYAEQIKELKRTITQNQLEFGSALSAKEGHREDQEKGIDEMRQQRDEAIARSEKLQAEISKLEDLRDELIQSKQELVVQHKKVLTSLREEQAAKDEALEQQKLFHESSLKNFQTRASSLEQDTFEYVNAVAAAQRAVEEKSRELSHVLTESRWIKVDQQALRDDIAALQRQLELEKENRLASEANWQQKLEQVNIRLEQANKASANATALRARDEVLLKQMEIDLATERANPCKQQVVELEARLTHITDHFTSQIESLTSERTTLRLLLEDEKARTALLQAELATANVRALEEDGDEDTDATILMEQGTRLKRRGKIETALFRKEFQSPAVKSAIGLLDGLGTYIGVVLRRNPAARLLFALYILLLHLWVVVVLYHTFHFSMGHVSLDPPSRLNGHNS